jgi:hypothetical protein
MAKRTIEVFIFQRTRHQLEEGDGKMKSTFLFICLFLLISCALTPKAKTIEEIDPNMAANCTFVHTVHGYSGWTLTSAKNQALNDAAELGATHIEWTNLDIGLGGANATGRAYRCHQKATSD